MFLIHTWMNGFTTVTQYQWFSSYEWKTEQLVDCILNPFTVVYCNGKGSWHPLFLYICIVRGAYKNIFLCNCDVPSLFYEIRTCRLRGDVILHSRQSVMSHLNGSAASLSQVCPTLTLLLFDNIFDIDKGHPQCSTNHPVMCKGAIILSCAYQQAIFYAKDFLKAHLWAHEQRTICPYFVV